MAETKKERAVREEAVAAFKAAQVAAAGPKGKVARGETFSPPESALGITPPKMVLEPDAWVVPEAESAAGVTREAINVRYQMAHTGMVIYLDMSVPGLVLPAPPTGKPRNRANYGTTKGGMRLGAEALNSILSINLQRDLTPEEKVAAKAAADAVSSS